MQDLEMHIQNRKRQTPRKFLVKVKVKREIGNKLKIIPLKNHQDSLDKLLK